MKEGVFAPLEHSIHGQRANPPGSKDFVTPNGSASIVSHFFRNSDTTVDFEHHVTAIKNLSDRWKVESNVRINFEYKVLFFSNRQRVIKQLAASCLQCKLDCGPAKFEILAISSFI